MKCQHCAVPVSQIFAYSIQNNQCPACGKAIMEQAQLTNFLRLQILLENNFPDIDSGSIATLVIANFNLQQVTKTELTKPAEEGIIEEESVEVEEEESSDSDPDAESKAKQKAEAKEILKKMREEALEGAQEDRLAEEWGLGNANGIVGADGLTHEATEHMKKRQSTDNILTGARGSFRR